MKMAFLTVVYPAAVDFLGDFLQSLERQTVKDFTLFVVNDGVEDLETRLVNCDIRATTVSLSGAPARLRKEGIAWVMAEGVDTIVFGDADDCFMENRVEVLRAAVRDDGIVCNELLVAYRPGGGAQKMLGPRLTEGAYLPASSLLRLNCLGLSNTAMTADAISSAFMEIPDDIPAFDWAFFTLCLLGRPPARYTGRTATHYRQHPGNVATTRSLTNKDVLRGVAVKKEHYGFLASRTPEARALGSQFEALHDLLGTDEAFRQLYCDAVRTQAPEHALWWESIRTREELSL